MRVRIEANEGELERKSMELAKSLLEGLAVHDPRLQKALELLSEESESPVASTPVMQALVRHAIEVYAEEMGALMSDIARELEES